MPPVDQYLDEDGKKASWTTKEVEEAKAKVKEWEESKAKEEAESSPVARAGATLTRGASNVGSFLAGVGGTAASTAASLVVGKKVEEPANGNGDKKELV